MRAAIFCSRIWLGYSLITTLLLTIIQSSYADNGIAVDAFTEKQVVSFKIANSKVSPAIYGFIITMYDDKQYSKIAATPLGWTAGSIKYQVVMWMTKDHPIQKGTTEDGFAIEVKQHGKLKVGWSAMDENLQPIAWGTIIIWGSYF